MDELPQPPPNAVDRWTVDAHMAGAANGSAAVEIELTNEVFGAIPIFTVNVDWKPGMEASDVEAHALALLMQSAGYLREALLAATAKRVI